MEADPVSRKTIMVVDGNRESRASTADLLELNGYPVMQAESGTSALDLLKLGAPAPALILAGLSAADGRSFLQRVRRRHWLAGVPIVLISTEDNPQVDGVKEILKKPVAANTLLNCVARQAV
ncbi:MAG: response regulator [Candidatus Binataceae bacterium]|jgi:CheY-like chemotaxis protein